VRKKINHLITAIEESPVAFSRFLVSFLGILLIRLLLEHFSSNIAFRYSNVLHFGLWFTAAFSGVILITCLITKREILKVSKVVLAFSPVILLPPVVDLLLSGGKGYPMSYILVRNFNDIWQSYIGFGGNLPPHGMTPGIKVEVAIILALLLIYVLFKTRKIVHSLILVLSVYTYLFLLGILPFILLAGVRYLDIPLYDKVSTITSFLFSITLSFVLIWLVQYDKKKILIFLKDIRPFRVIHYILLVALGIALYNRQVEVEIINSHNIFKFYLIPVSIVLVAVFAIVTNNIEDIEIDKISNKDRPLVKDEINKKNYLKAANLSLALALITSLMAGVNCFYFISLIMLGYYLYSMPPFKLKRIPVLSKAIIGLNSGFMALLGYTAFGGNVIDFPMKYMFFILIPLSLSANFIDIKDYEGDKYVGIKTMPVLFGNKVAKILISIFTLFAYLTAFLILKLDWLIYPISILCMLHIYFLNRKNYNEKPVFVAYLTGILGMIAALLFF